MSGVAVLQYINSTAPGVLALVEAERVYGGPIPTGQVPAVGLGHISGTPMLPVAGPPGLHVERVQATVHARNYAEKMAILAAVLAASADRHGTVNGVNVVSIRADIEGPDLDDPLKKLFRRSRDFIVTWRS